MAGTVSHTARRVQAQALAAAPLGEIMELIEPLAGHANLLALGAAVGAARNGDQTPYFATVAAEARRLTELATQASIEIESRLARATAADSAQAGDDSTQRRSLQRMIRTVDNVVRLLSSVRHTATTTN